MKVIAPEALELLESSIPEDDAPLWDAAATYAKDSRVMLDHVVYASLADDNAGKSPADWSLGTEAVWRVVGPTNRYACLDEYVSTQTIAPEADETLLLKVPFNRCTGFALLNFKASRVRAVVRDAGGEILHDETVSTLKDVGNWWEYYFAPLGRVIDFVRADVPISPLATLEITLTQEGGPRLGQIIAGQVWRLGDTLYSAQAGQRDYSRKDVNEYGDTRLIPRATARRTTLPLYAHPAEIDALHERLASLSGRAALWIGDNVEGVGSHQSLTVWGWLEDYRTTFVGPNEADVTLDIQGLI